MSPSSGKASGKTDGFTPIWPGVVPEEHQNCCSYTPQLVKRIAELEAELRTECVHCGQPIPHVHKHESTRELALRLRAEKAEAELAGREERQKQQDEAYERQYARAEKAEAEVERLTVIVDAQTKLLENIYKEGGGRESVPVAQAVRDEQHASGNHAANPAARKERDASLSSGKASGKTQLYNQATDRWEEVG